MKRTMVSLLAVMILTTIMNAQVPPSMSYQGYLTDNTGAPVPDGSYNFNFSLYTVQSGGTAIWTENHPTIAVIKGLFNVILGRGTPSNPLALPFDVQYYLGISVGADPELTPRVRLNTNAYSFISRTAEGVLDGAITNASVAAGAGIAASKLQPIVLTEAEVVAGSGINVTNSGGTLTVSAAPGAVTLGGDVTGPAGSNTIANNAVNAAKIASGQAVKGVNGLQDNVTLAAGANVTITPSGQTLTIAATGGGGGLTLPYTGSASSSAEALDVTQTGSGRVGYFHINNASSLADVLYAYNNSTSTSSTALRAQATGGRAIEAFNNSGSVASLYVYNSGAGPVAQFGNSSTSTGNIVEITKNGGTGRGLSMNYSGTGSAIFVDNNSSGAGLELKQDGTGNAAYFHIDNTTSLQNCLRAVSSSTNSNSDALEVSALAGNALDAISMGTEPTIRASSNSTSSTTLIMQLVGSGTAMTVDRSGNVTASGDVSADSHTATVSRGSSAPAAGRVYRDNVVYAWGRITAAGGFSGQSFGIQSVSRSNTDSSYTVTFQTTFSSVDDYAATVSPNALINPEFAVVNPVNANSCKVVIRYFLNGYMKRYYDDFYIIVTGRP